MRYRIFAIAIALALAACSGGKAPPAAPAQAQTPQRAQKTVFDDQLRALDKAKAMQKTIDQQKADQDQKIKDQGG